MKKLLLFSGILLFTLKSIGNPCIGYQFVIISELYFANTNQWKIEAINSNGFADYDSIVISSSTGRSKVGHKLTPTNFSFVIITADSLATPININPAGDSVNITIYSKTAFFGVDHLTDVLVFGTFRKAVIGAPAADNSIAKDISELSYDCGGTVLKLPNFNLNKAPNIGYPNITANMQGTLSGKIYYTIGQPAGNIKLALDEDFTTDVNGNYQTNVYARPHKLDSIWLKHSDGTKLGYYKLASSLDFDLIPSGSVTKDIYLGGNFVNIQDLKPNVLVKLFPNPVKCNSFIGFETELPVKAALVQIEILDINGRLLKSEPVKEKKGMVNLPANMGGGAYIVNFKSNGRVIKSSKVIVTE